MAAIYPGNVAVFSTKVDLQDTVFAEHVNALQDEVTAMQRTLGTGILSSTWASDYANPNTHESVAARLRNVEGGIRTLESTRLRISGGTLTGALGGTSATFSGQVAATSFAGSGAGLTDVNASNVTSGTLVADRLEDSGVDAGTYSKVEVDSKGRVLTGALLTQGDLPDPLTATTAGRWTTPRTFALSGDVSGSAVVDGSSDTNIEVTVLRMAQEYTTHFFLGGM